MTTDEEQRELKEISKHATDEALARFPKTEMPFWRRLGIVAAAIVLSANVVTSVYNTLILRQQIACERSFTNALNQVSDQSRDITKRAIDDALSGKIQNAADAARVQKIYDDGFAANTITRQAVLATTCHDGSTVPPSTRTTTPPK